MIPRVNHPAAWLTGYLPDLPTPFDENDRIDFAAFETLCERQILAGATAIVVGETAGETSTLTPAEHDAIVRAAVNLAQGRVRIIAGAGSNSTSQAIELTRQAETAGADAVISVVPYYNKPMPAGTLAHFQAIAASTGLPIILHDVPSRTVRGMSDETLVQLAQVRRFIGISDASSDAARLQRLRAATPPEFRWLSGDDSTALSFFAHGGDGCVSITSNVVPDLCQEMFAQCQEGQLQEAARLSARMAPLTDALLRDATSAPLKYALSLLGLMSPGVRLPIVEIAEDARAGIAKAIATICVNETGRDEIRLERRRGRHRAITR
jgi:4-hydroxy-tetrahydrodipicolinate synthase